MKKWRMKLNTRQSFTDASILLSGVCRTVLLRRILRKWNEYTRDRRRENRVVEEFKQRSLSRVFSTSFRGWRGQRKERWCVLKVSFKFLKFINDQGKNMDQEKK